MIDEIGFKILRILQHKARIPNVEVARQVEMAPSAVLERIRKLENQGYIDGYEVRLNPSRFNRAVVAFVVVRLTTLDANDAAGRELARLPAVQEVHFITGEDAFLVKLRVSGAAELEELIRSRIAGIPGVKETRTHIALATVKETSLFPIEAPTSGAEGEDAAGN